MSNAIVDQLRELISYDKQTGLFSWRKPHWGRAPGDIAGTFSGRYVYVTVGGKTYLAHRLAVLLETGQPATGDVDHIDGDKKNNRWDNLRCVSRAVNLQNQTRAHRREGRTSTYLGVSWKAERQKWAATISVGKGKTKHLGYFDEEVAAHHSYVNAKRQLHEGNTL